MPFSSVSDEILLSIVKFDLLNFKSDPDEQQTPWIYERLRALCLVNKQWCKLVQPLLFRNVTLGLLAGTVVQQDGQISRLARTLRAEPAFSDLVEVVQLCKHRPPSRKWKGSPIEKILMTCKNLRLLSITGAGTADAPVTLENFLPRLAARKLELLACNFTLGATGDLIRIEHLEVSDCPRRYLKKANMPYISEFPWQRFPELRHLTSYETKWSNGSEVLENIGSRLESLLIDSYFLNKPDDFHFCSQLTSLSQLALKLKPATMLKILAELPQPHPLTYLILHFDMQNKSSEHHITEEEKEELVGLLESEENFGCLEVVEVRSNDCKVGKEDLIPRYYNWLNVVCASKNASFYYRSWVSLSR